MSNQVKCNRCGYIFDSEEEEFGYCPCCENDQVEVGVMKIKNKFDLGDEVYYIDDRTKSVKKAIVQDIKVIRGIDMGVCYEDIKYNFLYDEYHWIIEHLVFNNKEDAESELSKLNSMYTQW